MKLDDFNYFLPKELIAKRPNAEKKKSKLLISKDKRIINFSDLHNFLSKNDFLAGKKYSIADIATFPWITRHNWHDIGLKKYKNLSRWYENISKRDAVIKGYDCLKKGDIIPKI